MRPNCHTPFISLDPVQCRRWRRLSLRIYRKPFLHLPTVRLFSDFRRCRCCWRVLVISILSTNKYWPIDGVSLHTGKFPLPITVARARLIFINSFKIIPSDSMYCILISRAAAAGIHATHCICSHITRNGAHTFLCACNRWKCVNCHYQRNVHRENVMSGGKIASIVSNYTRHNCWLPFVSKKTAGMTELIVSRNWWKWQAFRDSQILVLFDTTRPVYAACISASKTITNSS